MNRKCANSKEFIVLNFSCRLSIEMTQSRTKFLYLKPLFLIRFYKDMQGFRFMWTTRVFHWALADSVHQGWTFVHWDLLINLKRKGVARGIQGIVKNTLKRESMRDQPPRTPNLLPPKPCFGTWTTSWQLYTLMMTVSMLYEKKRVFFSLEITIPVLEWSL